MILSDQVLLSMTLSVEFASVPSENIYCIYQNLLQNLVHISFTFAIDVNSLSDEQNCSSKFSYVIKASLLRRRENVIC
jgi:hypothetical protein